MVCEGCNCKSFPLKTLAVIAIASLPDKRITAMAPVPGAVARATMVSVFNTGQMCANNYCGKQETGKSFAIEQPKTITEPV